MYVVLEQVLEDKAKSADHERAKAYESKTQSNDEPA